MKSLVVINIERELKKGQKTFTDKTISILLAHIDAYEKQIEKLKAQANVVQEKQPEPQP